MNRSPLAIGLLADVMRRHLVEIRLGDFDVIAEHGIEPHFERRDAGARRFRPPAVWRSNPCRRAGRCAVRRAPGRNRRGSCRLPSWPAAARPRWRGKSTRRGRAIRRVAIRDSPADRHAGGSSCDSFRRSRREKSLTIASDDALRRLLRRFCKSLFQRRNLLQRQAQRDQVARVAAAGTQAAERAFQIAHVRELRAKGVEAEGVFDERLHRVLPLPNRFHRRRAVAKASRAAAARPSA